MPAKSIVAEAFLDENIPATVLYTICLKTFGSEMHEWELETLWMEIQDEFKVDPADANKDKLAAAISLLVTNAFYENFQAFEAIGKGLNGQTADFEWITPLTPEEATWAVVESRILDSTPEDFSEEVKAYIREVHREGGLFKSPPALAFCSISSVYPAEKFVPKELRDTVEINQKLKLKKIEAYSALQKERLEEGLRLYLS